MWTKGTRQALVLHILTAVWAGQALKQNIKPGDAALSVQGVVAEAVPSVLKRLTETVEQSHKAGLFFFTYGDANNAVEHYSAQRAAGVDAIILDDTARLAKVCGNGKVPPSLFNLFAARRYNSTGKLDLFGAHLVRNALIVTEDAQHPLLYWCLNVLLLPNVLLLLQILRATELANVCYQSTS